MDKVLVTGGTGFVGHWLRKTQPDNLRVSYIGHNDYDIGHWKYFNFEYIIHAAPVSPVAVLQKAQKFDIRVLYVSSGIVYHNEWDTDYRQMKLDGEKECLDSGLNVVIARLFTFCGEGLDDSKAIVRFEMAAAKGEPLRVWGDGSCVRSYMPGEEMGKLLWAILLNGRKGDAYDVGSDEPVAMLELARRFSDNIIMEPDKYVAMPCYLPTNTAKTRALLD